ncbi:MAG: AraC family transcriptional regulator [candidate division KSB1 bacterium]|nr:AraC family transcriptional regulator [candidate division KSB1 bacterium]MDZ7302717.1 AraC family transcriptional regulator [candidate division KSB1 bacterium]MDZ7311752.1 AraC family transcriptional regulator [candidate division KSB1 bacterium]
MFTFANAILFAGAAQGLILAGLLLLKRRGNLIANRILAGVLVILSASILLHALSHAGVLPLADDHKVLVGLLMILCAPLVYLYTAALTTYRFRVEKKLMLHLFPFGAAFLFGVPLLIAAGDLRVRATLTGVLEALALAVVLVYIIAANNALLRHARVIRNNFSSLQKVNLNWLRVFVASLTLFWIFAGLFDTFFKTASWDVVWAASCVVIYLIGYFGFMQPEVFSAPVFDPKVVLSPDAPKYEKSSLTPEMAEAQFRKLVTVMEKEKLYLDKDFGLSRLAQQLGIPLHHLSQIINEKTGSNFYDYINAQRIEEAKRLLRDPQMSHRSIASVAFDAGFNSLSAFNAAFKKFVKSTPSQFRKQLSAPIG